jgi:hypothetical protein
MADAAAATTATGPAAVEHLFTESGGDYYAITDGLKRRPAGFL